MAEEHQHIAAIVLLMQPHDDSREMYAEFFRHHHLTVWCPDDAAHALTLAPSADVVITGLWLPGTVDGYTLIQRLRADEQTREKPIIVLTSWAWQTDRLRAKEAGCDAFLTKPCLPGVLLRYVRRTVATSRLREVRGHDCTSPASESRQSHKRKRTT